MPRLVSEHFKSDGTPKLKFPTKKDADKFIGTNLLNCYSYKCGFCGGWHLATIKGGK